MFKSLIQKLEQLDQQKNPEVISYRQMRRAIGYLGLGLPFALVLGSHLLAQCRVIQPSISHYYYTNMREIFEGTLFGVALFLFSYKGKSRLDSISSNIAGFFCVTVALFPTDLKEFPCQCQPAILFDISFSNIIHNSAAALFFSTLAFMSLYIFTKSDVSPANQTPQKRARNRIYKICGWTMLGSIVVMGLYMAFHGNPLAPFIFIFETVALIAFGLSWLTKGEAILSD